MSVWFWLTVGACVWMLVALIVGVIVGSMFRVERFPLEDDLWGDLTHECDWDFPPREPERQK
jgi:hypothetical protein